MPLYDIEHVIPLTEEQCEALAKAFTLLHSKRFNTPGVFINVRFTDASKQKVYRGGKLRQYNRAILRTRASENRSKAVYADHARDLIKSWDELICKGESLPEHSEQRLRTVWILGALTTGVELGIQRPEVGKEDEWLISNRSEFERLAAEGDEDMQELVESFGSN